VAAINDIFKCIIVLTRKSIAASVKSARAAEEDITYLYINIYLGKLNLGYQLYLIISIILADNNFFLFFLRIENDESSGKKLITYSSPHSKDTNVLIYVKKVGYNEHIQQTFPKF
jgi:hypothetical protein